MDILVNFSSLIVIIALTIFNYLMDKNGEDDLLIAIIYAVWFGWAFIYAQWLRDGFGNLFIAIITHSVFFITIIFLLISFTGCLASGLNERIRLWGVLFAAIFTISVTVYAFFCVYERLRIENILSIKIIDESVGFVGRFFDESVNFIDEILESVHAEALKSFDLIVNNEWIKLIITGALGSILGKIVSDWTSNLGNKGNSDDESEEGRDQKQMGQKEHQSQSGETSKDED